MVLSVNSGLCTVRYRQYNYGDQSMNRFYFKSPHFLIFIKYSSIGPCKIIPVYLFETHKPGMSHQ